MTNTFTLNSIRRWPESDLSDHLEFKKGINVIVGKPNTGKTQWLSMLNYMMGNPKAAAEVFDSVLVEKYDGISIEASIGNKSVHLERRWKESGNRSKVFVNGIPVLDKDFSSYLLEELNIPVLHFPSGNPYGTKTWPVLSWRSLGEHILC